MKRFIKKAAATALLMAGIFSAVPPAFCAPYGMINHTLVNERGRLDGYNAMIVGKYFKSIEDFQNLAMTNKKYRQIMERYHYNPVEIDPEKQLTIFPKMETYRMEEYGSPNFVYKFPEGISRLLYLPGSFNGLDFKKVVRENGIFDKNGEYNEDWECYLDIKDDFMDGFRFIFQSSDKEIVFLFDVCKDARLNCIKDCVNLMYDCGLDEFVELFLDCFYIPRHVTSIGEYAFSDWWDLKKINIPNRIKSIGAFAFGSCQHLEEVFIPSSVVSIGERAFEHCYMLEKVNIPSSVTSIGEGAFSNCWRLKNITLPNTITSIIGWTFSMCGLTEINIPSSVTSIGNYAFEGCNDLEKVHIPDSVTTIGRGAFDCCFSLERIVIPPSVTNLGERTFCRCSNLQSITIPTSVVDIDEGVFVGCDSLNHIEFGGNTYESVDSFLRAFKAYIEAHK